MNIAICILLFVWILLLGLLAVIYMLRMQGYDTYAEWKNRNEVKEVLNTEVTVVPQISEGALPPEVDPQETVAPEPTLPLAETMVFSGNEVVDNELQIMKGKQFQYI